MPASSRKLSANSRPVVLLRQWLASGKLAGDESPAVVQSISPVFSGYKLDNFRRAYNKLRKDIRTPLNNPTCQDGVESTELTQRCSDDPDEPKHKKARVESYSDEEGKGSDLEIAVDSRADMKYFKPIYMILSWEERHATTKRLSVAICLPSGVGCGDYALRVLSGRLCLEMRYVWPDEFCNIEKLHRKWLHSDTERLESYHPKLSGFHNFLKVLRKRNIYAVEQTARIQLPFSVESHIYAIYNLAWRDSTTRAVYLELRAAVEEYSVENTNASFEVV